MCEKLRLEREKRGWSPEYCADAVGVKKTTWLRYESGKRNPDKATMPKVRALFENEISADDFFPEKPEGRNAA